MIHRRFNHTRHLIWAAFLLTVFVSSAVNRQAKETGAGHQQVVTIKTAPAESVLVNTVAVK